MFLVDTNVLLHAIRTEAEEHRACYRCLERLRRGVAPWYLTWGIVYEFLRVATHPRVFERPLTATAAHGFIQSLLMSESAAVLFPTARHADVLRSVIEETPALSGNIWHDVETAALMREHGIRRIYTRDTHFSRFRFLEALDPLRD